MTTYVAETPGAFLSAGPTTPILSTELRFRLARAGKRAIDVVGAAAGLLLLAPVLLLLMMVVKLHDPAGPIFYRQNRLGQAGKMIKVLKFRTMRWQYSTGPDRPYKTAQEAFVAMGRPDLCAEFEVAQKVADDPRVSPLGALLRRTSLDELPQLVNALLGDLSLVGPRPATATVAETAIRNASGSAQA